MFKRFRDAITGRFVPKEEAKLRPSSTYGSTINSDRMALRRALEIASMQPPARAVVTLRNAILEVLDR